MSTIDELRSVLREWARGDRIGPAEAYVEPILQSAIREISQLTEENARLRESHQDLLDANRTLSAEIARLRKESARLKASCDFLTRETKGLASSLGKERADGVGRIDEIARLREENARLREDHG
jgi:predicted RNase H-like nuclease (RuvC/YqgF family)